MSESTGEAQARDEADSDTSMYQSDSEVADSHFARETESIAAACGRKYPLLENLSGEAGFFTGGMDLYAHEYRGNVVLRETHGDQAAIKTNNGKTNW